MHSLNPVFSKRHIVELYSCVKQVLAVAGLLRSHLVFASIWGNGCKRDCRSSVRLFYYLRTYSFNILSLAGLVWSLFEHTAF